jgi:transcription factor C subunit 6
LSEAIDNPISTLYIPSETGVVTTCFTWIGINRIALGHSDGSITLWSIRPQRCLLRHPTGPVTILDIRSGFPSRPYLIASQPVGGFPYLVDLTRPSSEATLSTIELMAFQPGLLVWIEHLQGFAGLTAKRQGCEVTFRHGTHYPISRALFFGNSPLTSMAIGAAHSHLLIGCADGSVWALGAARKVLLGSRGMDQFKLKIFENEWRSGVEGSRGAVRILQGFSPEANESLRAKNKKEQMRQAEAAGSAPPATPNAKGKKRTAAQTSSGKGKAKASGKAKSRIETADSSDNNEDDDSSEDEGDEGGDDGDGETGNKEIDPRRAVLHEPLTRISALAWNPNMEFGWWAATAMASGLIRVMDLGIDP